MPGRRDFVLGASMATTVAAVALTSGGCGGETPTSPLEPPDPEPTILRVPLMPVGATVAASIGGVSLAITRLSDMMVVAVSRICTHQGCTVLLPVSPGQPLACPCHGSRFTTAGAVVNGPAERPLSAYPARIEGTEVVVTLP